MLGPISPDASPPPLRKLLAELVRHTDDDTTLCLPSIWAGRGGSIQALTQSGGASVREAVHEWA